MRPADSVSRAARSACARSAAGLASRLPSSARPGAAGVLVGVTGGRPTGVWAAGCAGRGVAEGVDVAMMGFSGVLVACALDASGVGGGLAGTGRSHS